ncbi:MAG: flagellin, partial [Chloroflexota bacterium]
MPVNVNFNYASVTAQRNLAVSQSGFQKAIERLSSGLRINRAADDAAGLSISEKMRAQVRGIAQAQRNAQDGISLLQTGEGSLNEVHDILQRMRELAVQAGNSTLSTEDRDAISDELTALNSEIDRIGNSTQFNGTYLLKGDLGGRSVSNLGTDLTGANGINSIKANADAVELTGYTLTTTALSGTESTVTITDTDGNSEAVVVDTATIPSGGTMNVEFQNLGLTVNVNGSLGAAAIAANNTFDVAATDDLTLQIGANNDVAERMSVSGINDMRAAALGVSTLSVATVADAQNALDSLDTAIGDVSEARGSFGAYQNRLEHTINN